MAQMAQNNLTRHHEKISKITKQDANLVYTLYNTKRKTVVDVTRKQRNDLCPTIGQQWTATEIVFPAQRLSANLAVHILVEKRMGYT